jgi:hypothetical protein
MLWLVVCVAVIDVLGFLAWGSRNRRLRFTPASNFSGTRDSVARPVQPTDSRQS